MKRFSQTLATVALAAVALWMIERWCVRPWRCNVEVKRIASATDQMFSRRGDFEAVLQARTNMQRLRHCDVTPLLAVLSHTVAAANAIIAEQLPTAVHEYQTALALDRRPELYMLMATVQFEQGQRDEAVRSMLRALWFNPHLADQLPQGPGTLHELTLQQLARQPKPDAAELVRSDG